MSALVVVTAPTRPPRVRRGRASVLRDRAAAARCLAEAQRRSGGPAVRRADADGRPLAAGGWHWSWTHARGRVAASAAPAPVGVDVEWLRRMPTPALLASAGDDELRRLPARDAAWRLRLWTAKEALLKELGVGLGGLSRCRLLAPPFPSPPDGRTLVLPIGFEGTRREVLQLDLGEHVLSVACGSATRLQAVELPPAEELEEAAR